MAETRIIGELFKAKEILDQDVSAAVDAFMADPTLTAFLLGTGYTIDLAGAVADSLFAIGLLDNPEIKPQSKQSAVPTAILLAKAVKA